MLAATSLARRTRTPVPITRYSSSGQSPLTIGSNASKRCGLRTGGCRSKSGRPDQGTKRDSGRFEPTGPSLSATRRPRRTVYIAVGDRPSSGQKLMTTTIDAKTGHLTLDARPLVPARTRSRRRLRRAERPDVARESGACRWASIDNPITLLQAVT